MTDAATSTDRDPLVLAPGEDGPIQWVDYPQSSRPTAPRPPAGTRSRSDGSIRTQKDMAPTAIHRTTCSSYLRDHTAFNVAIRRPAPVRSHWLRQRSTTADRRFTYDVRDDLGARRNPTRQV